MNFRRTVLQTAPGRLLASNTITVLCLLLLAVLTFWGTLYQVEYGLYAAKKHFFNAWIVLIGGIVPFPAVKLVLSVLLVNLIASLLFRTSYSWSKAGIALLHVGIGVLIAGAGYNAMFSRESFVALAEGEKTSHSTDYHNWEFVVWEGSTAAISKHSDHAWDTLHVNSIEPNKTVSFPNTNTAINLIKFMQNCRRVKSNPDIKSSQSITTIMADSLIPIDPYRVPAKNVPGIQFTFPKSDGIYNTRTIHLRGGDGPIHIRKGKRFISFLLRRKQYSLPVQISLVDFERTLHPGTAIPKSFKSRVRVAYDSEERDVTIAMNKPFNYNNYTIYQSSYTQTEKGQISTLAVVKNPGRILPYIGSFMITGGFIIHFGILFIGNIGRRKRLSISR